MIFFSHITTVTGVVLPAKELCALARSKNILSAVDGAHVTGMMRLNLHDLENCDMYSSSPHKWLQATKGSGFLYVRMTKSSMGCGTPSPLKAGMSRSWASRTISAHRFVERAGAVGAAGGD